jgi:putative transposase
MARLARLVIPGLPHHVTQRGNGRARTFFSGADYAFYRDLLGSSCRAAGVEVWSWVLMPNHVHLILVPPDEDGLRRALAPVHRAHAGRIHARRRRTGHFWQGRFGAVVMDEPHLAAALRYGALNPVRARLVERAEDWPWASTRAHLEAAEDGLTTLGPVQQRYPRLAGLLDGAEDADAFDRLRRSETIGRPAGGPDFLERIEQATGRVLVPAKRGPKPKIELNALFP